MYQFRLCFLVQVSQLSQNGPSVPPEPSPQEMPKAFVKDMKHPTLRQGYIPIPVCHEGADLRQQHPCFSYIQPTALQNVRADGRTPSPTPTLHCRPKSPLQGSSESSTPEPCMSCSPSLQGPEVRLFYLLRLLRMNSYHLLKPYIDVIGGFAGKV